MSIVFFFFFRIVLLTVLLINISLFPLTTMHSGIDFLAKKKKKKSILVGSIINLPTFWVNLRQEYACECALKYHFCRQLTMFWHRAFVFSFSMSWIMQTLDLRLLLLHYMETVPRSSLFHQIVLILLGRWKQTCTVVAFCNGSLGHNNKQIKIWNAWN